jgi:hydrogenase expression/formation protein HypE
MNASRPAPVQEDEVVLHGKGAGGRLSAELLLDRLILPGAPKDAALLPGYRKLVMSSSSFVVSPLFFPGGDIGSLAVHGTVNDLVMRGAWPLALSVSLVIEQGLPVAELRSVVVSLGQGRAPHRSTGDHGGHEGGGCGTADRLFVNTTGIGRRHGSLHPSAAPARPEDSVLLSGGRWDCTAQPCSARVKAGGRKAGIVSDTRPLHQLVAALAPLGGAVHVLRDPTRGGLAAALSKITRNANVAVKIDDPPCWCRRRSPRPAPCSAWIHSSSPTRAA